MLAFRDPPPPATSGANVPITMSAAPSGRADVPIVDRLLWSASDLARLLGVSEKLVRRLDAMGRIPHGTLLGGRLKKWPASEIREWIQAGMPSRSQWQSRNT